MEFASHHDEKEIIEFYRTVIDKVNTTSVRLGWRVDTYPDAWEIGGPKEKIATIHALAVAPDKQGTKLSYRMLKDLEDHCREEGDLAIHLDVIDTNIPAYKLYTRNGYKEVDRIRMFYEVVGVREFWMLEHAL